MRINNPKRKEEHFPYYTYLLREGKLRRAGSKRRRELIEYYKEKNPDDYERYVRWCKRMEESTGKKRIC